jgi:hypothetical protein
VQDKTINELKQVNQNIISTVHKLISHNDDTAERARKEISQKMKLMENHIETQKQEKESMFIKLQTTSDQLNHALETVKKGIPCNCEKSTTQAILTEIKQNENRTSQALNRIESNIQNVNLTSTHPKILPKNASENQPSSLRPAYLTVRRETVIVIADSNGNKIRKDELCRGKKCYFGKKIDSKTGLRKCSASRQSK